MSKNSLPKATRKPANPTAAPAKNEEKLRFRRLIDKDEIEHIVTTAMLASNSPVTYTDLFCEKEGYVGKARARVHNLVEHVYGIRLKQEIEKKS